MFTQFYNIISLLIQILFVNIPEECGYDLVNLLLTKNSDPWPFLLCGISTSEHNIPKDEMW
jgi:hypothetical protein